MVTSRAIGGEGGTEKKVYGAKTHQDQNAMRNTDEAGASRYQEIKNTRDTKGHEGDEIRYTDRLEDKFCFWKRREKEGGSKENGGERVKLSVRLPGRVGGTNSNRRSGSSGGTGSERLLPLPFFPLALVILAER